jgi:acyl-CoA thioesterase-1
MSGRPSNSGVANLSERELTHDPDVVFIEFAVNDSFIVYEPNDVDYDITPRKSSDNLEAMIDAIRAARSDCDIILPTMNPTWNTPDGGQSGSIRPNFAAYYQGHRDVTPARGLTIVNN